MQYYVTERSKLLKYRPIAIMKFFSDKSDGDGKESLQKEKKEMREREEDDKG